MVEGKQSRYQLCLMDNEIGPGQRDKPSSHTVMTDELCVRNVVICASGATSEADDHYLLLQTAEWSGLNPRTQRINSHV